MTQKRAHIDIDPDYEDVTEAQSKRRRVLEEGAKEATKHKIEKIIRKQFETEIQNKQNEILKISETLERSRNIMDRLRAVIVANYYGNACGQKSAKGKSADVQLPVIHPTVKKFLGKAPVGTQHAIPAVKQEPSMIHDVTPEVTSEKIGKMVTPVSCSSASNTMAPTVNGDEADSRLGRFRTKRRLVVGNVSKSIPADQRDENDQATHKWMVYVRGPKDRPHIDDFVKKIWFFLHPSYRPNDLVEVSNPPFHLTRRGWGEFPVRVQIHFKDSRNKKLDIIHNLKLDRTYTGLQTLGSETVVDVELERDLSRHQHQKNKDAYIKQDCKSHISVKQEMDTTHDAMVDHCIPASVSELLPSIKAEPVDHDYGKSSCSLSIQGSQIIVKSEPPDYSTAIKSSGVFTSPTITASPVQTIFRPSIVTTQAISLVPLPSGTVINSPNKHHISPHASPVKVQENFGRITTNTVALSPARNAVQCLQQSSSVTLSSPTILLSPTSLSTSGKHILVSSSTTRSSNVISSPSSVTTLTQVQANNLVASRTNQTGLQAAGAAISTVFQTGLRLPGSPLVHQGKQGNQSANPGLVFLKCTDNQGKTYLIPQQVCSSLSPAVKTSPSNPVKTTAVTQTIFIGQNKVLSQNMSSQQPVVQLVSQAANTQKNINNIHGIQTVQNGPVLFIKPEGAISKTPNSILTTRSPLVTQTVTPVKLSPAANNVQIVRGLGQSQSMNVVNLKSPNQSNSANEKSLVKGQLMVTPQGLIQVQGQSNVQNIKPEAANGEKVGAQPLKQPIVLVPTNNKNVSIQGKTKSLLSPVVNNVSGSHSTSSIIVLNQSASLLANGNAPRMQYTMASNQNRVPAVQTGKAAVLKGNVIQAGNQSKTVNNFPPNHLVIIPVTSDMSVTKTTSSVTQSTLVVSSSNRLISSSATSNPVLVSAAQKNDKTMFILVQNEKGANANTHLNLNLDVKKSMSSLLGAKTVPSVTLATMKPDFSETQVMLTSTNNQQKQIILLNKPEIANGKAADTKKGEKKIIDLKKKKVNLVPQVIEVIQPLCLSQYSDMLSLIQAAIVRHPLISETASQILHPYCAKSREMWLSWNLGKRRASEWQRSSCVRKYIRPYLDDSDTYKGQQLWTTRQIVTWCRLHAYSPHYLERPLHPTGIDLQSETSLFSEKQHRKFSSLSNNDVIKQEVTALQQMMTSADSSDEEVDIESDDVRRSKPKPVKNPDVTEMQSIVENLPMSEGCMFVSKAASQVGLKLESSEVEPGYYGTLSHGILYKAMERFMEDILRETFAIQVNTGRYPDALGVADVYKAVSHLPITDFLTNKHLGVEEPTNGVPLDRG